MPALHVGHLRLLLDLRRMLYGCRIDLSTSATKRTAIFAVQLHQQYPQAPRLGEMGLLLGESVKPTPWPTTALIRWNTAPIFMFFTPSTAAR